MKLDSRLFTMRKAGRPTNGDWFRIENKKKESDTSKVYIYDEIGMWGTSASEFVKAINEIETPKMELHINSPGGNVFDGLAIYHAVQDHDAEVKVIVDAMAASAASFIAMAGNEVVMKRNATMMIHDASTVCFGNAADMRDTADLLDRFSDNIADIYLQKAGSNAEYWRALMREETWFSGQEAVTYGLADSVDNADDEEADTATDAWDLSFYAHKGRDDAESPAIVRERVLINLNKKEKEVAQGTGKATPSNSDPAGTPPAADPSTETPAADPATPPAEPAPAADPAEPAAVPETQNAALVAVNIGGQTVMVPQTVANHIEAQNAALDTVANTARAEFVASLASSNKILASGVDGMTAFAQSLSPEQFNVWKASFDAAQPLPSLGNHGQQNSTSAHGGEPGTSEDRIAVLEGTVDMLARSMSTEQLENTQPYKELAELRAANNKS